MASLLLWKCQLHGDLKRLSRGHLHGGRDWISVLHQQEVLSAKVEAVASDKAPVGGDGQHSGLACLADIDLGDRGGLRA